MKRPSSAREIASKLGFVEDVQAVADGERFHVAKEGIDAHQRLGLRHFRLDAARLFKPAFRDRAENVPRQPLAAPLVEALRRGIFVQKPLDFAKRGRRCGLDERRRVVADGDGGDAPLRLRGLAGIVDDEGIDHRHRPKERARRAGFRKRRRLAGQPFERAMRAEMDQRIDARLLAEPEIEGDVGVARRQVRIVIGGFAVRQMAALGLEADEEIAVGGYRQGNRAARECGVFGRRAPGGCHSLAQRFRQAGEGGFVFGEGPPNFIAQYPLTLSLSPWERGRQFRGTQPAPSPCGRGLG